MITIHPNTRALLFDCDGTLADTMPCHRAAWREAFSASNRRFPESFWLGFGGVPAEDIVRAYNDAFHDDLDPVAFSADKQQRVRAGLARARPIDPVRRTAHEHHGVLPMAVVSGGTLQNVRLILAAIKVGHLFDTVITADDCLPPKPAPDMFLAAAQRLAVPPANCQVFEDADAGVTAARRAGMIVTDVRDVL